MHAVSSSRSGQTTGSAVLAIDLGGRAIYCNGVAETMIGRPLMEIIGQPYDQIFRLDETGCYRQLDPPGEMSSSEHDRVASAASVLMVMHRDGCVAPVEHTSAPIRTRDGQVAGAMITFRYLADERQAA